MPFLFSPFSHYQLFWLLFIAKAVVILDYFLKLLFPMFYFLFWVFAPRMGSLICLFVDIGF
jgi:hypothetical protein